MSMNVLAAALALAAVLGAGACQSTPEKSMEQTVGDSTVTASIQGKLTADRLSNFTRVDVDTDHGVVHLSGVVPSAEHKRRAEELAREVEGVTRVENRLKIQTSKGE